MDMKETLLRHMLYDLLIYMLEPQTDDDIKTLTDLISRRCSEWNARKRLLDDMMDNLKETFGTENIRTYAYGESGIHDRMCHPYPMKIDDKGAMLAVTEEDKDKLKEYNEQPSDDVMQAAYDLELILMLMNESQQLPKSLPSIKEKIDFICEYAKRYDERWKSVKSAIEKGSDDISKQCLLRNLMVKDLLTNEDMETYKTRKVMEIGGIPVMLGLSDVVEKGVNERLNKYDGIMSKPTAEDYVKSMEK